MKKTLFLILAVLIMANISWAESAQSQTQISNLLTNNGGVFHYETDIVLDSTANPLYWWSNAIDLSPIIQTITSTTDSNQVKEWIRFGITATGYTDSAGNGVYRRKPSAVLKLFYSRDDTKPTTGTGKQSIPNPNWSGASATSAAKFYPATYTFMLDSATNTRDSASTAVQSLTITDSTFTGVLDSLHYATVNLKANPITPYLFIRAVPTWTNFLKTSKMYIHVTINAVLKDRETSKVKH